MIRSLLASAVFCAVLGPATTAAQSFPTRQATLVVPAAPGGPTDALARLLAERLHERLGQPFVVENRGGANGALGAGAVARATPDGHTILISVDGPIVVNPALSPNLPYDAVKDLQPVAVIGDGGDVVLAVSAGSPVQTVPELVALMRKDPARANYASSGAGFPSHIVAELFKREAKFDAQHIPMKGAGAAMQELLSGRMSFSFPPASLGAAQARGGKVRLLAVPAASRNLLLPDVPTFAEVGMASVVIPGYWIATYVPSATPRPVVRLLADAMREIGASAAYGKLLGAQGLRASSQTPEEISARVRKELAFWSETVRALNIRAD